MTAHCCGSGWHPEDYLSAEHEGACIFAEAIVAFILGIVDWGQRGMTGRAAVDELVGEA